MAKKFSERAYQRDQRQFTDTILQEWETYPDRTEFHMTRLVKVAGFVKEYVSRGTKILDVGCRDGTLLDALAAEGYTNLCGVDISPRAIKVAKDKGHEVYAIDVHSDDFDKVAFNREFDLVIMVHVLEHCYDPKKVLKQTYDMTAKGGYLLVEVPIQEAQPVPTQFAHYTIFDSAPGLIAMIQSAGFKFVIERPHAWGYGALFRR
jgi:2-polyprenyl-3-methyl-5-hydroxy-6-metoxy-1,4-benzoquinol methylase